jgi:hypothetical protein
MPVAVETPWDYGPVPKALPDAVYHSTLIEASSDAALLRLPTVGRYLVRPGHRPIVDPAPGATESDIRCFLRSTVTALQAVLAGGFPLRASAVGIAGRALIVSGGPAGGQSSLVAAVARRGHAVLADGVVLVGGDPPVLTPMRTDVDLPSDVAELLGLGEGRELRSGLVKRTFEVGAAADARATPLAAMIFIHRDGLIDRRATMPLQDHPTGQADAVGYLLSHSWIPDVVSALGRGIDQFEWVTTVAASCPVHEVRRASRAPLSSLELLADLAVSLAS